MPMSNVTVSVDDVLMRRFDEITRELGLGISGALNVFISAVVRSGGIPFAVSLKTPVELEEERFYSAEHMAYIDDACSRIERGETISFDSMDELEQAVKERMQCA